MKRICVIGDSSVAALKVAWDRIGAETPDVALTFFAAPGKIIDDLVVENGTLTAGSAVLRKHLIARSGGEDRIESACFDAYILSGMELNPYGVSRLHAESAEEGDAVARTLHGRTVCKVRQCTQSPLAMLPTPFRAIDPQKPRWQKLKTKDAAETTQRVVQPFIDACERFAARTNSRFVAQPQETIGRTGLNTRARFARSAARFFADGPDDFSHMNGDYGAIVLRRALAALS